MKVGDLVVFETYWNEGRLDWGMEISPYEGEKGVVLGLVTQRTRVDSTHIFIQWMVVPEDSDWIAADHRYLELVNESR